MATTTKPFSAVEEFEKWRQLQTNLEEPGPSPLILFGVEAIVTELRRIQETLDSSGQEQSASPSQHFDPDRPVTAI